MCGGIFFLAKEHMLCSFYGSKLIVRCLDGSFLYLVSALPLNLGHTEQRNDAATPCYRSPTIVEHNRERVGCREEEQDRLHGKPQLSFDEPFEELDVQLTFR